MVNDDTITRARAAVARLREAEGKATAGPWFGGTHSASAIDPGLWDGPAFLPPGIVGASVPADLAAIVALRNAAPALLRLAEAAGRLAGSYGDDPWWEVETAGLSCIGCGRAARGPHAADCPAMEIDAAMADLAVLAGDAGAGEVGA